MSAVVPLLSDWFKIMQVSLPTSETIVKKNVKIIPINRVVAAVHQET